MKMKNGIAIGVLLAAVVVGCARMEMPGPQGLMRLEVVTTGAVHGTMARSEDGATTMTLVKDFPAEQKNIWWTIAELGVKAAPAVLTVLIMTGVV